MSILLRPDMAAADAVKITTAAAVSVAFAGKGHDQKPDIKWVNDIYINGRKICGILTEAFQHGKRRTDYAVLGIGCVNTYEPEGGFPEAIRDIAGPIFHERKAICETE